VRTTVEVDVQAFVEAMQEIGPAVAQRISDDAVLPTLVEIVNGARHRVRRDTSRLANSLGWVIDPDGLGGEAGTNVAYAPYQEYGTGLFATNGAGRQTPWVYYDATRKQFVTTSGQPAQPYLGPSYEEQVPLFEQRVQAALVAAATDAGFTR